MNKKNSILDIAIIDDEIEAVHSIKNIIHEFEEVGFIEEYQSFDDFLKSLDSGDYFDVVLMDIQFEKEENGIDYAEKIFRKLPRIKIIFVTGYVSDYLNNIFIQQLNLAGIVEKPVCEEKIHQILIKVSNDKERERENVLALRNNRTIKTIPFAEITYIEGDKHNIIIHMLDKETRFYYRFSDIYELMPKNFLKCHKSYIVNLEYVKEIGNREMLLADKDKTTIPVSRLLYKEVKETFFEYIRSINL